MPCTEHEDEQQCRRASLRPTFNRSFAGLRLIDHQNSQSFSISHDNQNPNNRDQGSLNHHQHHHLRLNQLQQLQQQLLQAHHLQQQSLNRNYQSSLQSASNLNEGSNGQPDDITEQITISVQDILANQRTYANEIGGNISDVLDNYEENLAPVGNLQNGESANQHNNNLQIGNIPINRQNQLLSTASAPSTSTLTSHIYTPQLSNTISSVQSTRPLISQDHAAIRDGNTPSGDSINPKATQPKETDEGIQDLVSESNQDSCELLLTIVKTDNIGTGCCHNLSNTLQQDESRHSDRQKDLSNKQIQQHSHRNELSFLGSLPPYSNHRQAGVIRSTLYNGSSFSGFQKSKNESYEVNVKIQHVDASNHQLCGYMCINHLTKNLPSMTTFFEGEIISRRFPFLTRKWDATDKIDRDHWSKFDDFGRKYSLTFNEDSFDYDELDKSDYIYMRWKEHFLVPDHTIKHVEGASYAGFYYTCYSKLTSQIRGYYFHINSQDFERFQSLELDLDHQGSSQVYEFR